MATVQKKSELKERFLFEFVARMASPTDEFPTSRCWTAKSFAKVLGELRKSLKESGLKTIPENSVLLDWIARSGLVKTIPLDGETFQLVELGNPVGETLDPFELLMACVPRGTICYLSAAVFHGLTTQPAGHHHVASLVQTQAPSPEPETTSGESPKPTNAKARTPDKLGQLLFKMKGIPFYTTKVSARLTPGTQLRDYGPRSKIRIATYEQTLLDALRKPFQCGGPEVIFEAWNEGLGSGKVDEERTASYLTAMGYPSSVRRVAAMMAILGHKPGRELRKVFESSQKSLDPQHPHAEISLLPGVGYEKIDPDWMVRIP